MLRPRRFIPRAQAFAQDGVATSLHALVADLLDGGAVAGFAAGVLDAERGAVLAAGLVLVIDGRGGGCDGGAAVAEIKDVFDDRVAELRIGRGRVGIEGARGVEVDVEVLPRADRRCGEDRHGGVIRTALRYRDGLHGAEKKTTES